MTPADRQRLAAILGMLGSDHAGERAAAALQAEAFRKKHGLTWPELLAVPPDDETPEPEPEAQEPPPTPEPVPPAAYPSWYMDHAGVGLFAFYFAIIGWPVPYAIMAWLFG